MFVTVWLAVSVPQYIQASIDLLSGDLEKQQGLLEENVCMLIVIAIAMIIVRTLSRSFFFNPGRAIQRDIRNEALHKLNRLQKGFHDQYPTGKVISILNNDINGIRLMTGVGLLQIFNFIFSMSLTPIKMWELSPSLTLYCAIPVMVTFMIVNRAIRFLRKLNRERMVDLQDLSSQTVRFLSGIDVLKGFHIGEWASQEFEKSGKTLYERSMKISKIRSFIMPLLGYTDQLMKVLILAIGGTYLLQQELTIGEITAFLAYASLLAMPFMQLGRIIAIYQTGMVSIESIRQVLDQSSPKQDMTHVPTQIQQSLFHKEIQIKNLSYQYPDADQPTLSHISFSIKPGEKVGILGKIGSGKTTLVNCLNHYLEVEAGHIFIDGYDITQLSRRDLRSAVRTLTQTPFLFSASVVENITFGSHTVPAETLSLEETLYQSALSEEVQRFPEQEHTMVGEKGIMLSGGQKQRLSLARALYTPCKLLIFDDVLSAVDYDTERFLLQQIFEKLRAQSTLIVSNRVSILEKVDKILILDQGCIVGQGTHSELLERSEYYRQTWELQQQDAGEAA